VRKSSTNPEKSKYTYSDIKLGPFIRYYTKPGIFLEGFASFGLNKEVDPNLTTKWNNYSYGVGVGYCWFLNSNIAIEPEVKYLYTNTPKYLDTEITEKMNNLILSIGFQIFLDTKKQRAAN
jgi:opacity protein-like surface antigen